MNTKFSSSDAEKANYFYFMIELGQWLGVLPLEAYYAGKFKVLRFQATSIKVVYTGLHVALIMTMTTMCVFHAIKSGSHFVDIVRIIFYGTDFVSIFMFMVLTFKWPDIQREWLKLDKSMVRKYGYPRKVGRFLKVVTCLSFLYAFVQIFLFVYYNNYRCKRIAELKHIDYSLDMYLKTIYSQVFNYVPYSLFAGILCKIAYVSTCLRWMYTDVFLCLVSYILGLRFRQVSDRMESALTKKHNVEFWREVREDYNRICNFCCYIDNKMSDVVFSCFMTNLILMLVYMYNCTVVEEINAQVVYNVTMFVIVFVRTMVVTFLMASINEESKHPAKFLNSVSTDQYNTEIQRLMRQISFDNIGFTGYKMFTASRGTVLSIAGVLLTYELILVQFIDLKLLGNNS